jgi:hypothetical protein
MVGVVALLSIVSSFMGVYSSYRISQNKKQYNDVLDKNFVDKDGKKSDVNDFVVKNYFPGSPLVDKVRSAELKAVEGYSNKSADYFVKSDTRTYFNGKGLVINQGSFDLKLRLSLLKNRVDRFEIGGAPGCSSDDCEAYLMKDIDDVRYLETNYMLLPSVYDFVVVDKFGYSHQYKVNLFYEYSGSEHDFDYTLWSNSRSSFVRIVNDGFVVEPPQKKSVNAIVFKKRFTGGLKAEVVFAPVSDNILFSINLSDKVSLVFGEDGRRKVKLRIAKNRNGKFKSETCTTKQLVSKIEKGTDLVVGIERVGNRLIVRDSGKVILEYHDNTLDGKHGESFRSIAICNWRKGGEILIKRIKIEGVE